MTGLRVGLSGQRLVCLVMTNCANGIVLIIGIARHSLNMGDTWTEISDQTW
jgi:hypothetical protein